MDPEQLQTWITWATPLVSSLLLGIAILVVGWMASKWAARMVVRVGKERLQPELTGFFSHLARYTVLAAAVIAALGRVGVETTSLITLLASAGLAVGLALQGSLSNFASGVMILLHRPFAIGDRVTVAGHSGFVQDIGLFATTMTTPENETIIIPNSAITGASIVNHTTRGTLRGTVNVGVAYGTDLARAMEICAETAKKSRFVIDDPAVAVAFVNFGASSLDLAVHCWCRSEDLLGMLHHVRVDLYDALNANGIEIPFDQIVVHEAPRDDASAA